MYGYRPTIRSLLEDVVAPMDSVHDESRLLESLDHFLPRDSRQLHNDSLLKGAFGNLIG